MNTFLFTVVIFLLVIKLIEAIKRIAYLRNDDNFNDGAHWPDWLIEDAKKWNDRNPRKGVNIRY